MGPGFGLRDRVEWLAAGGISGSFFSQKRIWPDGPYLHFLIVLDDPGYQVYVQAHQELFATYGDRLGVVPKQWLHSTVQGIHHRLTLAQVEQAVEAVRRELAWNAAPMTVQMGPGVARAERRYGGDVPGGAACRPQRARAQRRIEGGR